jgi:hypothetical protein
MIALVALCTSAAASNSVGKPPGATGCLPTHNGFLRARLRGALDLDLNWHDAEMQCQGGLRPEGQGLRIAISGPTQSDGRRLRFVFGIADASEDRSGHELPTNVTVIFETEGRLFSTQGDAWCTTDSLTQERIDDHAAAPGGELRTWRVIARGFCTGPATTPGSSTHLLLERFDFAGLIQVGSDDAVPAARAGADTGAVSPAPGHPPAQELPAGAPLERPASAHP